MSNCQDVISKTSKQIALYSKNVIYTFAIEYSQEEKNGLY